MKATRVFQLTALALIVVAAVQVGWWLVDQRAYTIEKVNAARSAYAAQTAAAQALLDSGTAPQRVAELLPQITVHDGRASLATEVAQALTSEEHRRINQYAWEGAFFLLALGVCIAVIARALSAEARVLEEQDNFLALVSHQFKTPLASLQLSLETLSLRSPPPAQARTLIDRMLSDLARMSAMVTQILESARLERGRVELRAEPLELRAAVARIVTQLEERPREARVAITNSVEAGLYVMSDPLALDVVVRNVLENALAAVAGAGGGDVVLNAKGTPTEVELSVTDSGVGFDAAARERLFEKFTRFGAARSPATAGSSHYGTGLGLYIVQRLMQLTHGRVAARSDGPGRGASFVLTWPAAEEPRA
jgi:signal transduction histidine kinase